MDFCRLFGIVTAGFLLGEPLGAQADSPEECITEVKIAPVVVRPDSGSTTVGARFAVARGSKHSKATQSFARQYYRCAEARGLATARAASNPDDMKARLAAGALFVIAKVVPPDPTGPPNAGGGFDYGYVNVGVQILGEANQRFTESLVALRGELVYTHDQPDLAWQFVPHLLLAYGLSRVTASRLRDSVGASDDNEQLFDATVNWGLALGALGARGPLGRLTLIPEVRHFEKTGVDVRAKPVDVTRGTHLSVMAMYPVSLRWISAVFVEWMRGPLPAQSERRRAWLVGVVSGK
jgi:hypothetical protein